MTKPCWTACWFQHTAARRRLDKQGSISEFCQKFQHTAARRRLGRFTSHQKKASLFQHTAARRRLVGSRRARNSSHGFQHTAARRRLDGLTARPVSTSSRFNTQPPEGGWGNRVGTGRQERCFNTQPPEGGWQGLPLQKCLSMLFQHTAARRRLAQSYKIVSKLSSFNTQPPEGGWDFKTGSNIVTLVSTHSRPKAAGGGSTSLDDEEDVSTHSRPKAAGRGWFLSIFMWTVSTHSRPKAAGW